MLARHHSGRLGRRGSHSDAGGVRGLPIPSVGVIVVAALVLTVPFAGCGSGSRSSTSSSGTSRTATTHSTSTPNESSEAPFAALARPDKGPPRIKLASNAPTSSGGIGDRYTCKGANISPSVTWKGLPRQAKELVVFVETLGHVPPVINWAVAGLNPALAGIASGKLPRTAVVGRNSFGQDAYSVCPRLSSAPTLIGIVVIAVPHKLNLHRGFDSSALLTATTKPGAYAGSVVMVARKPSG